MGSTEPSGSANGAPGIATTGSASGAVYSAGSTYSGATSGAVYSAGAASGSSGCSLAFSTGSSSGGLDAGPSDVTCWSPGPAQDLGGSGSQTTAPLLDGVCSLVGTWDYAASEGYQGVLSFDPYGNWVGGPAGTNLCAGHTMDGTYSLSPSLVEFVTINDCMCPAQWSMSWVPTFDATCSHATLREKYDNCTGARSEFNNDLTLTKQ